MKNANISNKYECSMKVYFSISYVINILLLEIYMDIHRMEVGIHIYFTMTIDEHEHSFIVEHLI